MSINLRSLIAKLNDASRIALEGAAGLCLSRTHYDVEVEHYLMKLLESSDGASVPRSRGWSASQTASTAAIPASTDSTNDWGASD